MIDPADTVTEALPLTVPCPIRLRSSSPDQVYVVSLEQDLLGDWCVVQSWGCKQNRRGGGQVRAVESFDAGLAIVDSIRRRREQRGYQIAHS